MNQFRGLSLTRRGEFVLAVLLFALFGAFVVAVADRAQDEQCAAALATGTQWRIDRICEPGAK